MRTADVHVSSPHLTSLADLFFSYLAFHLRVDVKDISYVVSLAFARVSCGLLTIACRSTTTCQTVSKTTFTELDVQLVSPDTLRFQPDSKLLPSLSGAGAKGTAFAYFTADQSRLARDLVKILADAQQQIPPELSEMASFGGGGSRSGFGGRGRGRGGGRGGYSNFGNRDSGW